MNLLPPIASGPQAWNLSDEFPFVLELILSVISNFLTFYGQRFLLYGDFCYKGKIKYRINCIYCNKQLNTRITNKYEEFSVTNDIISLIN